MPKQLNEQRKSVLLRLTIPLIDSVRERAYESKRTQSDIVVDALNLYFFGSADYDTVTIDELKEKKALAEAELQRGRAEQQRKEEQASKLSAALLQKEQGKRLTKEMFQATIESELQTSIEAVCKHVNNPVAFSKHLGVQFEILRKTGWEGTKEDLLKLVYDKRGGESYG